MLSLTFRYLRLDGDVPAVAPKTMNKDLKENVQLAEWLDVFKQTRNCSCVAYSYKGSIYCLAFTSPN